VVQRGLIYVMINFAVPKLSLSNTQRPGKLIITTRRLPTTKWSGAIHY